MSPLECQLCRACRPPEVLISRLSHIADIDYSAILCEGWRGVIAVPNMADLRGFLTLRHVISNKHTWCLSCEDGLEMISSESIERLCFNAWKKFLGTASFVSQDHVWLG
jgi:hypothetical protein